jgi:hypothetical protein
LDEYLPAKTLHWCNQVLSNAGYELPITAQAANVSGARTHKSAYIHLATKVEQHMQQGNQMGLDLCNKPTGALRWQPPATEASA